MKILDRPIAITDIETTGLDFQIHEIIEIGLIVVDQQTLEILDKLDVKIKPEHLETATEFALKLNGYNEADWQEASTLREAMMLYSEKTREAMFCAYNVTFDWSFIAGAFKKSGVENQMDYRRIDLLTVAWLTFRNRSFEKFSLSAIAKSLGIGEEPMPHRAINGAMCAYEVYKRLVK